jgi:hypothetical protein
MIVVGCFKDIVFPMASVGRDDRQDFFLEGGNLIISESQFWVSETTFGDMVFPQTKVLYMFYRHANLQRT